MKKEQANFVASTNNPVPAALRQAEEAIAPDWCGNNPAPGYKDDDCGTCVFCRDVEND